jgi:hypothetical protein
MFSIAQIPFLQQSSPIRHEHYPKCLSDLFKEHRFDPKNVPFANISARGLHPLMPNAIQCPIMRIQDGLILHVKAKESSTRTFSFDPECPIRNSEEFWVIYKDAQNNNAWTIAGNSITKFIVSDRHREGAHLNKKYQYIPCTTCPFQKEQLIEKEFLRNLLTGKDPDFQIGNETDFNLFAPRQLHKENT